MLQQNSLVEYGSRRVIITITAVFCAVLEIIDTTIVNVALNNMKGSLGATLSEVSWVITAYSIANVIIVPMTSWLSQQFGRRNYFAASVIIFTVASFMCGNSTSISELIIFRFIQGLGGGALLVTSQTIITESYPPEKRAMAQAIYVLGVIIGPTLGPPLGGYIVDHFSWPYIFYINIPVGIVAALLALQYVRSPKYAEKRPASEVDWLGIFLLTAAVGALQYILEKGQEDDWFSSNLIIVLTVVAGLGLYCFIWREMTYQYPIVELRVLKDGNLRMGVILSFVQGFGLFGSTFIIPLYTQTILGWDATQSGMLMIPSTLMVAFMMPIIGQMIQRGVPHKYLIAVGMIIFFVYSLLTYKIITPQTGAENFFWVLMIRGVGLGLLSVPISTMALSTLKGVEIGQGAAFSGMMRQLGGSFGVALITTYLSRDIIGHRSNIANHLDMYDPDVQNRIHGIAAGMQAKGMAPNVALKSAYTLMDGTVSVQATVLSYMDIFLYVGCMFLICVPFVLIFIKRSKAKVSMADAAH
ncbi:DHA2 family efflux MFS transporter permease subunit [Panacibacter ginsenosidivorans]|uniref:DHA2 family efflux MFS transporter permease subunit n=1 Tax=Panacibacter ginsenosidivorans TaxID=1813871 RepID=A0A5B8VH24_9BACT|nr:DHA2 family efflux MFS transporter permease subunit [Panacibacter ginsenosidivorans]QEC69608.1 DHA2 family efflux MFS transporter permease subunit [Panacibacter ginsenosidivorans]